MVHGISHTTAAIRHSLRNHNVACHSLRHSLSNKPLLCRHPRSDKHTGCSFLGGKGGGCAQGHTFQAWSLKLHSAVKQSSAILCPTCCTTHTGTTWPSVGVPTATSQRTCQPHTFRPTQRYCFWHHTNEVMCASNTHTCCVQLPACGAEQQTGNSFKDKFAHTTRYDSKQPSTHTQASRRHHQPGCTARHTELAGHNKGHEEIDWQLLYFFNRASLLAGLTAYRVEQQDSTPPQL
jgi:hypothetical protein